MKIIKKLEKMKSRKIIQKVKVSKFPEIFLRVILTELVEKTFTCLILTIETLEQDVVLVFLLSTFNILHLVLGFVLLTLNMLLPAGLYTIAN